MHVVDMHAVKLHQYLQYRELDTRRPSKFLIQSFFVDYFVQAARLFARSLARAGDGKNADCRERVLATDRYLVTRLDRMRGLRRFSVD